MAGAMRKHRELPTGQGVVPGAIPGSVANSPDLQWNTDLSPEEEQQFQDWASRQSAALRRPILNDLQDYDMRGLFRDVKGGDLAAGHFTDKFKKPNHPTFSDQSMYQGRNGLAGGRWVQGPGGWEFYASPHNAQNLGPEGLARYFNEHEQGVRLILPGADEATARAEALNRRKPMP
jgi:hypothetical protein